MAYSVVPERADTGRIFNGTGQPAYARVNVTRPIRVSQLVYAVTTAGAAITSSYVGLYSMAGALLASVSTGTSWQTAGIKVTNLTTPIDLPTGFCVVAWLVNTASTRPNMLGMAGAGGAQLINYALTAPGIRSANGQAITTLPPNITTMTGSANMFWVGLA